MLLQKPEDQRSTRQYFPAIDALRAFAALMVVFFHVIGLHSWDDFPETGLLSLFRHGWMGVDLFFVISGFAIAYSGIALYREQPKIFAQTYLRRRLARIVPLHYLTSIAYVVLLAWSIFNFSSQNIFRIFTQATFTFGWFPDTHQAINPPSWSIAVEMQFYILMLFIIPYLSRWRILTIIAIFVPIAWAFRLGIATWLKAEGYPIRYLFIYTTQLPGMLDEFCAGIVMAKIALGDWMIPPKILDHIRRWGLVWAVAICSTVYLVFLTAIKGHFYSPFWGLIVLRSSLAIAGMALVGCAIYWRPSWLSKLPYFLKLPWQGILYLGRISYGIYLWQSLVIRGLIGVSFEENKILVLVAAMAIIISLSIISWHFLEKPFIRWASSRSRRTLVSNAKPLD